jgi:hypothetical protein
VKQMGALRQMGDHTASLGSQGEPEPDVAISKAVAIITRARKSLDKMRGDKGQLDTLRAALYEADAELGYAAWQVGTLKGQVKKERRAKEELEGRVAAITEALQCRVPRPDA